MQAMFRDDLALLREAIGRQWFWIVMAILITGILVWLSLPLTALFFLITDRCA